MALPFTNPNGKFWHLLHRPIMALAPMDDVTDAAFRRIIAKCGKPDIMFTEFVSADGLCSKGKDRLMGKLIYDECERPIVVQLFGKNPENFFKSGQLAHELGFDGIDINMGCPDKNICRSGAGAALINAPETAKEIIEMARDGSGLPISVKTRIGYDKITVEDWIGHLLEAKPVAITVHLRTKKDMSKVPARWSHIAQAIKMTRGTGTLLLGNGDIPNIEKANEMVHATGVDGIMLGRAIFGNPWLFNANASRFSGDLGEKLKIMIEHAQLYEMIFSNKKNFRNIKKHFKAYLAGLPNAKGLREKIADINCADQLKNELEEFLSANQFFIV